MAWIRALALLLWCGPLRLLAQEEPRLPRVVTHPAAAFFGEYKPFEQVLEMRADFDGDGHEDVAFADHALFGHRGNGPWDLFLRRSDGKYVEAGAIEYRRHLRIVRRRRGVTLIRTYVPGGGDQGVIITYRVSKRGLVPLKREDLDLEADGFRIEQVFGKDPPERPCRSYTNEEFRIKAGV